MIDKISSNPNQKMILVATYLVVRSTSFNTKKRKHATKVFFRSSFFFLFLMSFWSTEATHLRTIFHYIPDLPAQEGTRLSIQPAFFWKQKQQIIKCWSREYKFSNRLQDESWRKAMTRLDIRAFLVRFDGALAWYEVWV